MDLVYILKGMLIAIVEGITEFLPISSTGHLIITNHLLDFGSSPFENMYMVVIQLGAILAIIVLYWDKLWGLVQSLLRGEKRGKQFTLAIIIGSIPAAILGFLLDDFIDQYLLSVPTVIVALIFGAILMILFENRYRGKADIQRVEDITPRRAIIIGLFQTMAMWPGMSRSASTIMGGWNQGLAAGVAAEFSFFLAIPIMFGASGVKLVKYGLAGGFQVITQTQVATLIIGFIVSFLVALFCVRAFVSYLQRKSMKVFAYYRFILAGALVIFMLVV